MPEIKNHDTSKHIAHRRSSKTQDSLDLPQERLTNHKMVSRIHNPTAPIHTLNISLYFFSSPSFFPPHSPPKYPPALFPAPATPLPAPFTPSTAPCPYPPSGPWDSMGLPFSSLPPRSARLMPSLLSESPTGCSRPPWPTCPETRPLTPSCRLSTCETPVTFVFSRFSVCCVSLIRGAWSGDG